MCAFLHGTALVWWAVLLKLSVTAHWTTNSNHNYIFNSTSCSLETCRTLHSLVGLVYPAPPAPFNASDGPLCAHVMAGPPMLSACGAVRLLPSSTPCCSSCCNGAAAPTTTTATTSRPDTVIAQQPSTFKSSAKIAFLIVWVASICLCVLLFGISVCEDFFHEQIARWMEPGSVDGPDAERMRVARQRAAGKEVHPARWCCFYQRLPWYMCVTWSFTLFPVFCCVFIGGIVAWCMTMANVEPPITFGLFGGMLVISICVFGISFVHGHTLHNPDQGEADLAEEAASIDKSVVKQLRIGNIRLLSCSWLRAQGYRGDLVPLSRQQDLPDEAFLTPSASVTALEHGHVYVLSYAWLTPEHPDPHALTLRCVIHFLLSNWLLTKAAPAIGLFWDYACLPQKPHTNTEKLAFTSGLAAITNLYGSLWLSTVIQVKTVPSAPDGSIYSERPYSCRGWCVVEEGVARFAAQHRAKASHSDRKRWAFPKLVDISEDEPKLPDLTRDTQTIDGIWAALAQATFTSSGDREEVTKQLKGFNTMLSFQRYQKHRLDPLRPHELGARVVVPIA